MTLITPQVAITELLVVEVWVAVDPPCEPSPLWLGVTLALLLPPLAVPIAVGLQVMSMFPATISLVADGFEVAFELPTVDVPVAWGDDEESAFPPFVVLLVLEFALALEPPPFSPDDEPEALALALLPFVLPVVAEFALEPEPAIAAAATEIASASALDRPVTA